MVGRPVTVEIYGLYCPDTGALRYIGKANSAAKRFKTHLADSRRRKTPLYIWIQELGAVEKLPRLEIVQTVSESDWQQSEIMAIAEARASGADLLNVAKGGNAPFCDRATRQQNARAVVKLRTSTPQKKRLYELKRALGHSLRQGFVGELTKEKMRMAARRRPDLFGFWANI